MPEQDTTETARMMIEAHGLRAQAIALEHVAEMRQRGDTAGLDHWQRIYAAICELRRTGPSQASKGAEFTA
jgi:hypothetical protein